MAHKGERGGTGEESAEPRRPRRLRGDTDTTESAIPSAATGAGAWLMPFTDIVTLLLIFFVIFTTLLDEPGDTTTVAPGLLDGGGSLGDSREATAGTAERAWNAEVDRVTRRARAFLAERDLGDQVDLQRTDAGARLRLADDILFPSGAAEVQRTGRRLLDRLVPLLRDVSGRIRVEGHTDDLPIDTARYPSNWELSAARAIAVVKHFRRAGVDGPRLAAVGHGPTRPIADNATQAGRARNRRVAVLLRPPLPGREAPVWPPSLME